MNLEERTEENKWFTFYDSEKTLTIDSESIKGVQASAEPNNYIINIQSRIYPTHWMFHYNDHEINDFQVNYKQINKIFS